MTTYFVYAEDMDGKRRLLDKAIADNIGKGLFGLYANECGDEEEVVIVEENPAAALGRKGGSVKSNRKAAAVRENGKKGGRPKKEENIMKLTVSVPPTMEQGSYVCIADNKADALWQYNSARAHDGLMPLKRMPNGTEYKTVITKKEV